MSEKRITFNRSTVAVIIILSLVIGIIVWQVAYQPPPQQQSPTPAPQHWYTILLAACIISFVFGFALAIYFMPKKS